MRTRKGAALLAAIAFTAIFAMIVGGLTYYTVGTYTIASKDADFEAAIQIADAALNYEIRKISQNQFTSGYTAPTSASPDTGYADSANGSPNLALSGVQGTFSVWVSLNSDGTGTWTNTQANLWLWAKGTVNGVTREVKVQGVHGDDIFSPYALFGVNNITISGSGSTVNGSVGSNGTISSPSQGSGFVPSPYTITLSGSGASGVTGSNVNTAPDPVNFPTVTQIVNATFPGPPTGFSYLTDNSPVYRSNGNVLTVNNGVNSIPSTATNGDLYNPGDWKNYVSTAGSPWNSPSSSTSETIKSSNFNGLGKDPVTNSGKNKVLILPPGDYYMTDISLSGNTEIMVDNGGWTTGTPGAVRIWMNNSVSNDSISQPFVYTATSHTLPTGFTNAGQMFRLYYNKQATFALDGNTVSGGSFYAVTGTSPGATLTITGGSTLYGSVISDNLTVSGNSLLQYPTGTASGGNDKFWLWFGIQGRWQEQTPPGGGAVFPDGTSN